MRSFSFTGPLGKIECLVHNCTKGRAALIMVHGFRGSCEGGGRATLLAEQLASLVTVVRLCTCFRA